MKLWQILGIGGGCVLTTIGITVGIYAGLGTLGWNMIKKHVNYEDKYYQAVRLADTDKDGNLDYTETDNFFKELEVTKMPGQEWNEVKPAYSSLAEYVKKRKD